VYATAVKRGAFAEQLALAVSCGGQVGIALSLGSLAGTPRAALWGMLIVEILLVAAMQNRLHRFLSALAAALAWAMATHELIFPGEVPGISLFGSQEQYHFSQLLMSIALWLVVWGPVLMGAWWLVAREANWMADGRDAMLRPVMQGLIAALAVAPLATHPATFWMTLGFGPGSGLREGSHIGTPLWPLLAVVLALAALALSFAIRHRALMGLAIVFALLELSAFYYILGTTLLVKSAILLALGTVLLLGARQLRTESK